MRIREERRPEKEAWRETRGKGIEVWEALTRSKINMIEKTHVRRKGKKEKEQQRKEQKKTAMS